MRLAGGTELAPAFSFRETLCLSIRLQPVIVGVVGAGPFVELSVPVWPSRLRFLFSLFILSFELILGFISSIG